MEFGDINIGDIVKVNKSLVPNCTNILRVLIGEEAEVIEKRTTNTFVYLKFFNPVIQQLYSKNVTMGIYTSEVDLVRKGDSVWQT